MISNVIRSFPMGNLPEKFAFVEINRTNSTPWWFDDWNTFDVQCVLSCAYPLGTSADEVHIGPVRIIDQAEISNFCFRVLIEDASFRIKRTTWAINSAR